MAHGVKKTAVFPAEHDMYDVFQLTTNNITHCHVLTECNHLIQVAATSFLHSLQSMLYNLRICNIPVSSFRLMCAISNMIMCLQGCIKGAFQAPPTEVSWTAANNNIDFR